MKEQKCGYCKNTKPIEAFEWQKDRPNPRKTCIQCRHKIRVYTEEHREQRRVTAKKYRDSGRAKIMWERHKYGVSKDQCTYEHCFICGSKKRLSIDHDHNTETPRGLLCSTCNTGLGMFHDDKYKLMAACAYLDNFPDFAHWELHKDE